MTTRISSRILKELDAQVEDEIVKELAKELLRYELENWKVEKLHFKDEFTKKIASYWLKRKKKR